MSWFLDLRPQYTSNGKRYWSCSTVARQEYSTYDAAKAACLNDWQCMFVLDQNCDDTGAFKLCTARSFIEQSSTDCLYNKEGKQ